MKTLNQIKSPLIFLRSDLRECGVIEDITEVHRLCTPVGIRSQCYQKFLFYTENGDIYVMHNVNINPIKLLLFSIFSNVCFFVKPPKPAVTFDGFVRIGNFNFSDLKTVICALISKDLEGADPKLNARIRHTNDYLSLLKFLRNYFYTEY